MSLDQPRTPAGSPTGGQFAQADRPEGDVELAHGDALSPWPGPDPQPEVSWRREGLDVRTTFTFADGTSSSVRAAPGDPLELDWSGKTPQDEAAAHWMAAVHERVDNAAYDALVEGLDGAATDHDGVLARALGRSAANTTAPPRLLDEAHGVAWPNRAIDKDATIAAMVRDGLPEATENWVEIGKPPAYGWREMSQEQADSAYTRLAALVDDANSEAQWEEAAAYASMAEQIARAYKIGPFEESQ